MHGILLRKGNTVKTRSLELFQNNILKERVEIAKEILKQCRLCPRECLIDRTESNKGVCRIGYKSIVSSAFPHNGEEFCLSGFRGSGTIFFTGCSLKCVFCQNFDISYGNNGMEVSSEEIALMMMDLQYQGCHNVNFVTPDHVVAQILEAIYIALSKGFILPIVYNTSGYCSLDTLKLLDGVIDIYMPDFKFFSKELSKKYQNAPDYPKVAATAILEMYRQVGTLRINSSALATKGLIIRHLVMPGCVKDSKKIIDWIKNNLPENTYINIMGQYHPHGKVTSLRYQEINRRATLDEVYEVEKYAINKGLKRLDSRCMF